MIDAKRIRLVGLACFAALSFPALVHAQNMSRGLGAQGAAEPSRGEIEKFCAEYPMRRQTSANSVQQMRELQDAWEKYCVKRPSASPAPSPAAPAQPVGRIDRISTPSCLGEASRIEVRGSELTRSGLDCRVEAGGRSRVLKPASRSEIHYLYRFDAADRLPSVDEYRIECRLGNERNSVRVRACEPSVTPAPAAPVERDAVVDLVPSIESTSIEPGRVHMVPVSVFNHGSGGPSAQRYQLSLVLTTEDASRFTSGFSSGLSRTPRGVLVEKHQWMTRVPAGGSGEPLTMTISVPGTLPDTGDLFWCAIVDGTHQLADVNRANNIACSPAREEAQVVVRHDLTRRFGASLRTGEGPALAEGAEVTLREEIAQSTQTAEFALLGPMMLRVNDSLGPIVDVAEGAEITAQWNSDDFVEPLDETLDGHWLIVSDALLRSDPCESVPPEGEGIVGDGAHTADTFSTALTGLTPGATYYLKLCVRTSRGGEIAWRHESQQITLKYGVEDGFLAEYRLDTARIAEMLARFGSQTPDLAVADIVKARNGQLVIVIHDARGRESFRDYHDARRATLEELVASGSRTAFRYQDIYPFRFKVLIDNEELPTASLVGASVSLGAGATSYLPRSGIRILTTDGYYLPGDGRPHSVRVEVEPFEADADPSNNVLAKLFTGERDDDARFNLVLTAAGTAFETPFDSPHGYTSAVARSPVVPSMDEAARNGGFFYLIDPIRGNFSAGNCVTSRHVRAYVSGTAGRVPIDHIEIDLVGHDPVHRERISGSASRNPWRPISRSASFDLQPLLEDDSRAVTIRATITDTDGRRYVQEVPFRLMGSSLNSGPMVRLSMDRIYELGTNRDRSVDRRGGAILLPRSTVGEVSGSVSLNGNNCALERVWSESMLLYVNPHREPRISHGSQPYGQITGFSREGNVVRFNGDINLRQHGRMAPGLYEVSVRVDWRGMHPVNSSYLPGMASEPMMILEVP